MKSVYKSISLAALAALAVAASGAFAQAVVNIPVPASSAATGGRAVISIRPMTPGDVQNIVAAMPPSGGAPWTMAFIGQGKRGAGQSEYYIADGGYLYYREAWWASWRSLGIPYLNNEFDAPTNERCDGNRDWINYSIGPSLTANSNGTPLSWGLTVTSSCTYQNN